MDVNAWAAAAAADAERRGLPDLRAMLETLAKSTANLRAADATRTRRDTGSQAHQ